ncbi:MAG: DUF6077 domain-containing protein [Roseburia inulinivorans]
MIFKNVINMTVLFFIMPIWIGNLWGNSQKDTNVLVKLCQLWSAGFVTILAVAQIILVPLVTLQKSLTMAVILWKVILGILSVFIFLRLIIQKNKIVSFQNEKKSICNVEKNKWIVIYGLLVGVMIFIQVYVPVKYEHSDDDDSRFIAEEVSAVVHDTMYIDDPITASEMYWDLGEVKKDLTSPWAMYVAMCSKISGIAPAVLSHTYLPFYLILMCYAVYFLIGYELMKKNIEKTLVFLIIISVLNIWGYTSTHTLASMLLLRIWQGKAICASFILPFLFYVMCKIMYQNYEKKWLIFLYVISIGASLLSGVGIITVPVMILLYAVVDYIYHRKIKKSILVLGSMLPSILYLSYYLVR